MRLLFSIDTKDYDINGIGVVRPSSRSIIVKEGRIALVHSQKYHYYKFPGGGIEKHEAQEDALVRETLEEAGLKVIKESIKPYGYVHRIQKSAHGDCDYFLQDNFYYLCDVEDEMITQTLDDYEADEGFQLVWMGPVEAIKANREIDHGPKQHNMIERESRVLEILLEEGYFE